jgi:sugar phosphate isomerase/epimerase
MIYISTGGFSQNDAFQTSRELISAGCEYIELSAGKYKPDLLESLKKLTKSAHFRVHNYFPPPKKPFVLNLASQDEMTAQSSIDHIIKAIQWSVELDQPVYSFHAGFLMDPKVEELGRKITPRPLYNRRDSLSMFIDRVNKIDEYAQALGVSILIENNVLSANNYKAFKSNPFLMATADECIRVMSNTSDNVRLLIDVAHLKVSSNSLRFDPAAFLVSCHDWICAYHLSDNDGTKDSNSPISCNSWFWPHLRRDLDYYSLEVYNLTPAELFNQLSLASELLSQ